MITFRSCILRRSEPFCIRIINETSSRTIGVVTAFISLSSIFSKKNAADSPYFGLGKE